MNWQSFAVGILTFSSYACHLGGVTGASIFLSAEDDAEPLKALLPATSSGIRCAPGQEAADICTACDLHSLRDLRTCCTELSDFLLCQATFGPSDGPLVGGKPVRRTNEDDGDDGYLLRDMGTDKRGPPHSIFRNYNRAWYKGKRLYHSDHGDTTFNRVWYRG